jgi:hypothetical protein
MYSLFVVDETGSGGRRMVALFAAFLAVSAFALAVAFCIYIAIIWNSSLKCLGGSNITS